MAFITPDRVQETTTTTGTGTLALGGASAGYRAFSAVCAVGDTVEYAIADATAGAWEVGVGTYSAASTLTRTTVYSSSNAGAAVSLAGNAGTLVFATASAKRVGFISLADGRRLAWDGGAVVTAGTWSFDVIASGVISNLLYEVGSAAGSFTVAVSIAGTNVTGLSAVAVSSATRASATATGANTFGGTRAAPVRITFTISAVSGSPTGAVLLLLWDKA